LDEINRLNEITTIDIINSITKIKDENDESEILFRHYLLKLDYNNIETYCEFSADKASINNFKDLLKTFGISYKDVLKEFEITDALSSILPIHLKLRFERRYNIVTPDRKLVFTIANKNEYFHYLGVSGERDMVYKFFMYFIENGEEEGMSFGGRDYI